MTDEMEDPLALIARTVAVTCATQVVGRRRLHDHVRMDPGALLFECEHCGEHLDMTKGTGRTSVGLDLMVGCGKAFLKQHRRCKKEGAV